MPITVVASVGLGALWLLFLQAGWRIRPGVYIHRLSPETEALLSAGVLALGTCHFALVMARASGPWIVISGASYLAAWALLLVLVIATVTELEGGHWVIPLPIGGALLFVAILAAGWTMRQTHLNGI